jgi:hypothetical protein
MEKVLDGTGILTLQLSPSLSVVNLTASSLTTTKDAFVDDRLRLNSGSVSSGSIQATVNPINRLTYLTNENFSLGPAQEGEMKILINNPLGTGNGTATVTVEDAGWKASGDGIVMLAKRGDSVTMIYSQFAQSGSTIGKWFIIGSYGNVTVL